MFFLRMVTTFSKLERFVSDRIYATYFFWLLFVLIYIVYNYFKKYMIVVQEWADGDVGLLETEKEKNEIYATPEKQYGATQIQVTKQKAVFSFLPNKN